MLIELHLIQNFAPSNLNRDDTGSPKDCEFGGFRRARISSQCIKRAIRRAFREQDLIGPKQLGLRTKRVINEVADRLEQQQGTDRAEALGVAQAALSAVELTVGTDGKTQYLLFLGDEEIEALCEQCHDHWDVLLPIGQSMTSSASESGSTNAKSKKKAKRSKKDRKSAMPKEVVAAIATVFSQRGSVDVALFGRMLADMPEQNIFAASQVAHALSTHRVSVEFDYYTAIDDLKPDDTQGADMLGTVEFNSACFYRYLNVDTTQLERNLGNKRELATLAVEGFLRAAISAIPTGKQNSMAAHNPPTLVAVVARKGGPWSLANAFVSPVRPDGQTDLVQQSVLALDRYWGQLTKMYGADNIHGTWCCVLDDVPLEHLAGSRVDAVSTLVEQVMTTLTNGDQ